MTLVDLLKLRAEDAPWYTKWWWWACIAGAVLLAVVGFAASQRMVHKERERRFRKVEKITEVIVDNEHAVDDAKVVLKEAAKDRKKIDEIDDEVDDVEERYDKMIERVENAETLDELRELREEMVRRGL
jgi:hypothetical protein